MRKIIILFVIIILFCGCSIDKKSEQIIFGATYMTRNNPYFDVLNNEIAKIIEMKGDKLIVRDPLQDQEKQNIQILDMIEEGIQILFLNPVDKDYIKPALEKCKEAGVKIINIDTKVEDSEYVVSTIETNNYQAGQECAKDMIKRVESAKILVLDNPLQNSITQRVNGFLDVIKNMDNYEVIKIEHTNSEIETSAKVVEELIKKDLQFDVVFGGNDPTALGALAALQKTGGENNKLIYGVDGSPDFKAMIKLGYVTGTSMQSPKTMGKIAAQTAYKILKGEQTEKYIRLPSSLITYENLHLYDIDGWQ